MSLQVFFGELKTKEIKLSPNQLESVLRKRLIVKPAIKPLSLLPAVEIAKKVELLHELGYMKELDMSLKLLYKINKEMQIAF